MLKVLKDEHLYEVEKRICGKLEGTLATLKLVNAFTFEFPSNEEAKGNRHSNVNSGMINSNGAASGKANPKDRKER